MSSDDGLKILKKWQTDATTLLLYSRKSGPRDHLFEVRVRVASIDGTKLTLSLEGSEESETLDFPTLHLRMCPCSKESLWRSSSPTGKPPSCEISLLDVSRAPVSRAPAMPPLGGVICSRNASRRF